MSFEKIYIIGKGRVAKVCAKIATQFFSQQVFEITEQDTKELDRFFSQIKNALIISANNFYIFKKECVKNNQIINYHNSLLPKHRGLNAHIWSIFENDKKSGITWHKVEESIDTGDILIQKEILLDENISGINLLRKQHELAIESFEEGLSNLISNQSIPQKCALNEAVLGGGVFNRKLPNNGYLKLSWNAPKIHRFLRAMEGKRKAKIKLLGGEFEILFYECDVNCIHLVLNQQINLNIKRSKNANHKTTFH